MTDIERNVKRNSSWGGKHVNCCQCPCHRNNPKESIVEKALRIAESEIGYKEGPNNQSKFGAWYGMNHQPWCAMFLSWVLDQAGHGINISGNKGFAYCPTGRKWFQLQGLLYDEPQVGDIAFFDWYPGTTKSGAWHVGIVKAVHTDGTIVTIEGNTGPDSEGVYEMVRKPVNFYGFGRWYI